MIRLALGLAFSITAAALATASVYAPSDSASAGFGVLSWFAAIIAFTFILPEDKQ